VVGGQGGPDRGAVDPNRRSAAGIVGQDACAAVEFQLGSPFTSPAARTVANLPAVVTRGTGGFNATGCTVTVVVELPGDGDACVAATALTESVVARLPR